MKDLDWSDLKLFLAVARAGGLGPASRLAGVSAPTLGRRIAALERALAQHLFTRGRQGYALTERGRALLVHAEAVEAAVAGIIGARSGSGAARSVRVSAGSWMTSFLAQRFGAISLPEDDWSIDFVTASATLDIGRRAADIGIRNRRPDTGGLAGRRVATVCFAAYRRRGHDGPTLSWLRLAGDAAITPSAQWLERQTGATFAATCSDPRTLLDLALSGAGLAVLPCLIGDTTSGLERASGLIAELSSEQWLVTHHEDRHDPAIHAVAKRIARLIVAHRPLFAGERPEWPAGEPPGGLATERNGLVTPA